jgi:hypothetical protein
MRIDLNDFVDQVDKDFWKHITRQGEFKDVKKFSDIDRESFLKSIARSINAYKYQFDIPTIYYSPKSNGILRKVKVMSLSDSCLYYYVVKSLQDEIVNSIKETPNVYGGFRMTPELKVNKEEFDNLVSNPKYEKSFSVTNFRKEWSDYQNLSKDLYTDNYSYYLHLDIAHFYDDINLHLLESTLQNISKGRSELINLLFILLRNSDKIDLGYQESTVGLPQESIGEMSRILANLYLTRFDKPFKENLLSMFNGQDSDFKYIRYADDIWVAYNGTREKSAFITQNASKILQKNKLHLNECKTKLLTREDFNRHWKFSFWEEILNKKEDTSQYIPLLNRIYKSKNGRWFSPFSYLMKIVMSKKVNISLFKRKSQAILFINRIIENPQFELRINSSNLSFFKEMLKKFPEIEEKVVRKIVDQKEVLHPSLQYFAIELITKCSPKNNLELIFNRYLMYNSKDFHWFSRCICLEYLSKKGADIVSSAVKMRKLTNNIQLHHENQPVIERRYSIFFLMSLPMEKGKDLLDAVYILPEDLKFRNYLRKN